MKITAILLPSFSLLFAIAANCPAAQAGSGGATYTPGTDQHLTEQGLFGAKTRGYSDCGRAAEADLHLPAKSNTYTPSEAVAALIGTQAPEFADDLKWANCQPLSMAKLRGHPVFIRFWYRDCPMCQASAPLMNALYDQYNKEGLVVIGIHHSKTSTGDTIAQVTAAAQKEGFQFPIAIDNSWNTIGRFWIHSKAREYSSASFLIDKNGIIVWGHDLGRLEKDTPAATSLHEAVRKTLESGASAQAPEQ